MKDDDFKPLRGFGDRRTNERTDICDCRVAFATENIISNNDPWCLQPQISQLLLGQKSKVGTVLKS